MNGQEPVDLAVVDALVKAATPGPWRWDRTPNPHWGHQPPDLVGADNTDVVTSWGHDADGVSVSDADATLIAAAPTYLAALSAEVASLRAQVAAVEALCADDLTEQEAITEHHVGNEGPVLARQIRAVLNEATRAQAVERYFPGAQPLPLRAEAIAENHPELTCQRCGGPNLLGWSAPNEIWNVGVPGRDGILCPQCFALAYETATGTEPCWDLRPSGGSE